MRRATSADLRPRPPRIVASTVLAIVAIAVLGLGGCADHSNLSSPPSRFITVPDTGPETDPSTTFPLHRPGDPVDGGGPPSSEISQESSLLNAVHGTWKGEAGTLEFHNDGTADFTLHDCPTVPGGPRLGYSTDCPAGTWHGRVSLGNYQIGLATADNNVINHNVYMDRKGQLHVGQGQTFTIARDSTVTIDDVTKDYEIVVQGNVCQRHVGTTVTPEPCQITKVDGAKVLTVDGTAYVNDESVDVLTSPSAYYGVFTR